MSRRVKRNRMHRIFFATARTLFGPLGRRIYAYRADRPVAVEGPFLLVANHVTAADPVLLGLSSKKQMYFVASEHLMQKGLPSKLLEFFLDPIVRRKGDSAVTAVREMLGCLKNGLNVCVFPEGTCSFDGTNSPMLPTIGRLAKATGCSLVTFRFEGGYFTLPRWGRGIRRGSYRGGIVNVYPPEALKTAKDAEINEWIANDLNENAYTRQQQVRAVYRSKHRAEYLESAFSLCPACKEFGTLETQGDSIRCSCGMRGTLDEEYRLINMPVKTLPEWDAMQAEWLEERAEDPSFTMEDADTVLVETDEKHRRIPVASGTLCMTPDTLSVGSRAFLLSDISDMELVRRNLLVFSTRDGHYQISGCPSLNTRKYMQLYRIRKGEHAK